MYPRYNSRNNSKESGRPLPFCIRFYKENQYYADSFLKASEM